MFSFSPTNESVSQKELPQQSDDRISSKPIQDLTEKGNNLFVKFCSSRKIKISLLLENPLSLLQCRKFFYAPLLMLDVMTTTLKSFYFADLT